jgi:hypothetical protein
MDKSSHQVPAYYFHYDFQSKNAPALRMDRPASSSPPSPSSTAPPTTSDSSPAIGRPAAPLHFILSTPTSHPPSPRNTPSAASSDLSKSLISITALWPPSASPADASRILKTVAALISPVPKRCSELYAASRSPCGQPHSSSQREDSSPAIGFEKDWRPFYTHTSSSLFGAMISWRIWKNEDFWRSIR